MHTARIAWLVLPSGCARGLFRRNRRRHAAGQRENRNDQEEKYIPPMHRPLPTPATCKNVCVSIRSDWRSFRATPPTEWDRPDLRKSSAPY